MPSVQAPTHEATRETRLGLVSDTHGLVRPALEEVLRGVDAILHAGDVGSTDVLTRLGRLAPVRAVCGNTDACVAELSLPAFECHACGETKILIAHYLGEPEDPLPPAAQAIERFRPRVVVSGHTPRPDLQEFEGRLYVNPGSAGPRRFRLPVTCGLLRIARSRGSLRLEATIIDLETGRTLLQTRFPDGGNG